LLAIGRLEYGETVRSELAIRERELIALLIIGSPVFHQLKLPVTAEGNASRFWKGSQYLPARKARLVTNRDTGISQLPGLVLVRIALSQEVLVVGYP